MPLLSKLRRIQEGGYGGTGFDSSEVINIGQTKAFDYYDTLDSMPFTGETGRKAYVNSTGRLYVREGQGWYNVATANLSPAIDSIEGYDSAPDVDKYSLTADSFNMTVIASDSDDNPKIFTYSHTLIPSSASTDVRINHDSGGSNVFNLQMDSDADVNSFQIAFTVNDGVNISTITKDFNVVYAPPPPVADTVYTFSTYHIWTQPQMGDTRPQIEFAQDESWSTIEALHQALDSAISASSAYLFTSQNYPHPIYLTLWDSGSGGSGTDCVYVAKMVENSLSFGTFIYNNSNGITGASVSSIPVDDGTGTFFAGQHYHNYSGSSSNPERNCRCKWC